MEIAITLNSHAYPNLMKEMNKPPKILYGDGDIKLLKSPCVAIVGTRHPTEGAKERAYDLAALLASRGYTIVSGLAHGIDTAAHDGALSVSGKTIAVLGTSLRKSYPPENKGLQQRITKDGLLVTEYDYDSFQPERFKYRDYLQAALSIAVIAIQAGRASGTLHSLRAACDLDRLRFFEITEISSQQNKYGALWKLTKEEYIPIKKFRMDQVEELVLPMIEARRNHV